MTERKIDVYPYRPPKKYPQKDLHGRMRSMKIQYRDLKRFQNFYVNVFGWDMCELPLGSGGKAPGDPNPHLLIASGPAYETWEGVVPGHFSAMGIHTEGEVEPPMIFAEIHMDRPLSESLADMLRNGGTLEGDMPAEEDNWVTTVRVKDPSGNVIEFWKCPSSRTWEEPETGYDREDD